MDPADGAPAQADGDDFPDAEASDLLEQYVAADRDGRRKAAEQLGEAAGMAVLRRLTDDDGPDIRYPTADEPVPDSLALTPGVPWPTAFAFAGRNVTNIVWWDGDTVRVIEAKGGDSQYGTRQAGKDDAGQDLVVHQGSEAYLEKIADAMANSPKEDGRTTIGDILAEAIEDRLVDYDGVRCGPRTQLLDGPHDGTLIKEDDFGAEGNRWGWGPLPKGQKGPAT